MAAVVEDEDNWLYSHDDDAEARKESIADTTAENGIGYVNHAEAEVICEDKKEGDDTPKENVSLVRGNEIWCHLRGTLIGPAQKIKLYNHYIYRFYVKDDILLMQLTLK